MVKGSAAFVLPSYGYTQYITIENGDHFGIIDIMGSSKNDDFDIDEWYLNKNKLIRQFSVQATSDCEELTLDIAYLY